MKRKSSVFRQKAFMRIGNVYISKTGLIVTFAVLTAIIVLLVAESVKMNPKKSEDLLNYQGIENTPIMYSVEQSYSDLSIDDVITLGSFEQDGNYANGKDNIEWNVLAIDGENALLLSKHCLDYQPYNDEVRIDNKLSDVTWETCSLRKWLNNSFYNYSFSTEIKRLIIPTVLKNNKPNEEYGTCGGNDTTDKLFLLSSDEVEKYLGTEFYTGSRRQGISQSEFQEAKYKRATWWLRSAGSDLRRACYVDEFSNAVSDSGDEVDLWHYVRPAMWINYEAIAKLNTFEPTVEKVPINVNISSQKNISISDIVTFGIYEQDGVISNGEEGIEWIVVAKDNEAAFLISKYCIEEKPIFEFDLDKTYNDNDITWENSSLRYWLNNSFYNSAFKEDEKKRIIPSNLTNENENCTTDYVFLLSCDETMEYLPSMYELQGLYLDVESGGYSRTGWWLRTQGDNPDDFYHIAYDRYESISSGCNWPNGVRPALWIKLNP